MVVGYATAYAISAYHHWSCDFESRSGDVYSIQHYVIKLVNELRLLGGFLLALRFPPPITKGPQQLPSCMQISESNVVLRCPLWSMLTFLTVALHRSGTRRGTTMCWPVTVHNIYLSSQCYYTTRVWCIVFCFRIYLSTWSSEM
jgi:hypothetical protein